MTETPRKGSNIRQAVDFGALLAFMVAYAVNRFA
ncbi:MAG: intracellular septation protein A, partial [Caulobacteraceae bacterium]